MNYSAEIVAAIQEEGIHDADALADRVGLSTKSFDALVSKLCGEGTLRRDGHRLTIQNEGRARMLAEQAGVGFTAKIDTDTGRTVVTPTSPRSDPPPKPVVRRALNLAPPPDLKIEANIPVPDRWRPARAIPWPFGNMAVGQSFAVPIGDRPAKLVEQALRRDADAYRQRIDPKFFTLIRIESSGDSVRLWRTTKFERKAKADAKDPAPIAAGLGDVAHLPAASKPNGSLGNRARRKASA